MISFWQIFSLETLALIRSKTLALLAFASVLWMLVFPSLAKGDGTLAGARELDIHYSLGGVFLLLVVSLLASATGTIAHERTSRRLQLTLVRPVRHTSIVLGKVLAHVFAGAVVLAIACLPLFYTTDFAIPCNHVLRPELPSPMAVAREKYESYVKAPDTPAEIKKAPRSAVLRLLAQRAADNYQTVQTNASACWTFDLTASDLTDAALAVRMRFTNLFSMRQDVVGEFRLGEMTGVVSNITQAILVSRLSGTTADLGGVRSLCFANRGRTSLMVNPRKDLALLVSGDAFGWNLLRAYLVLVSVLALVIAFGVFLSASLGRPVAVFTAFVVLIVGEMSPSVIERYPDTSESNLADHIGLCITRATAAVTRPISSLSPLEALAKDECVEWRDVGKLALSNLLVLPLVLTVFAAAIMPRKQEET